MSLKNSLQVTENKIILASSDDQIIKEIPFNGVEGWVLCLNTTIHEDLTITSSEPQRNDIKQLQQVINLLTIKGSFVTPYTTVLEGKKGVQEDKVGVVETGSGIEIGDVSDSG